ncbi:hypothetical protein L1987_10446 [Smallanthus sonchifolius]|uniref:Uncharacterized protein n=1 Tax=Smallanthus sonchifolius TaxID=185202 RepID=A0ACB9JS50_9ASTR|nr:hypothetical protein L1987_10446 [Smallanthus sonchifolius]
MNRNQEEGTAMDGSESVGMSERVGNMIIYVPKSLNMLEYILYMLSLATYYMTPEAFDVRVASQKLLSMSLLTPYRF